MFFKKKNFNRKLYVVNTRSVFTFHGIKAMPLKAIMSMSLFCEYNILIEIDSLSNEKFNFNNIEWDLKNIRLEANRLKMSSHSTQYEIRNIRHSATTMRNQRRWTTILSGAARKIFYRKMVCKITALSFYHLLSVK